MTSIASSKLASIQPAAQRPLMAKVFRVVWWCEEKRQQMKLYFIAQGNHLWSCGKTPYQAWFNFTQATFNYTQAEQSRSFNELYLDFLNDSKYDAILHSRQRQKTL